MSRRAPAGIGARAPRRVLRGPAVERVIVPRGGIDRPPGVGFVCRAAARSQAPTSSRTSNSRRTGACVAPDASRFKRRFVVAKELRVRIFARQQLQQQLVQVKAAEQRRSRRPEAGRRATPLSAASCSSPPPPTTKQRLECLQHPAQLRARPPRPARDQRDPPVVRAERLDDQAGLPIRVSVQHEGGLFITATRGCFIGVLLQDCARSRLSSPAASAVPRRPPSPISPDPDLEEDLAAEQALHVSDAPRWRWPSSCDPPSPSRMARWLVSST